MKKLLLLGLMLTGFSGVLSANTETDQEQINVITAECKQEAEGAIDAAIYAENCVEEKLQALKEKSGQSEKDKS